MSLLILGADFPEKCDDCPCCEELISGYCDIDVTYDCSALYFPYHPEKSDVTKIRETGRLNYCPARKLPDKHGPLIDKDELLKRIEESGNFLPPAIKAYIETADVIIEQEAAK